MTVERSLDLTPAEWVRRRIPERSSQGQWPGIRVDACLPGFESYVRALHPIYGGESNTRFLWKDLAGPLFPGNSGKALTGTGVGLIVNRACGLIGLDQAKYGAHSLRAGFVTTAAELGMPETLIMQRTGHRSVQTVARYVRPARLFHIDALAAAF